MRDSGMASKVTMVAASNVPEGEMAPTPHTASLAAGQGPLRTLMAEFGTVPKNWRIYRNMPEATHRGLAAPRVLNVCVAPSPGSVSCWTDRTLNVTWQTMRTYATPTVSTRQGLIEHDLAHIEYVLLHVSGNVRENRTLPPSYWHERLRQIRDC